MSVIEDMVQANARYADRFRGNTLSARPVRRVAVVACMDARIDLFQALGLAIGDAHIIRNAGGRVADALRSLAISQQMLGTEAVAVIHHTDCGLLSFTDVSMRKALRANLGAEADHLAFLPYDDTDEGVRSDLRLYRQSVIVRQDIPVRGFVFEVGTGRLREIDLPGQTTG